MLAIENVSAGYGDRLVLQDVSVRVARGEFVGLVGPNGCGKTTLLRVMSGILSPRKGQVQLQGCNVRQMSKRTLARIMACLLQDLSLDVAFSVREVAMMGRTPHLSRIGRETQKDFEIVQRALELADVAALADRPITEISGGERQRAFIAMCLAQEPEALLLDEPTNHLDIGHQLSILNLIGRLNRQNQMTILAVFHDLNLAAEYCDRLLVLNAGRVVALGAPHDVLTAEMVLRVYGAKVLVERNPLSQKPHVVLTADVS